LVPQAVSEIDPKTGPDQKERTLRIGFSCGLKLLVGKLCRLYTICGQLKTT